MPDEMLLSMEGRLTVRRAVECLPEHYRAVLILRDVEELSSEEVAEILGESVASVKSRLHRARMALRELLTRTYAPGPPPAPNAMTAQAPLTSPSATLRPTPSVTAPISGGPERNPR